MKILLSSYVFPPSMGGIEVVSAMLAEEFHRLGHEVKVVTQTKEAGGTFDFDVIRRPGRIELMKLVKWCDVFFQNNISLTMVWPWMFLRRPLVVTHQVWLDQHKRERWIGAWMKRWVLERASNIAISSAVAKTLKRCDQIVGNPYRDHLFKQPPVEERPDDIVFVGRLVSDKGCEDLIRSVIQLKHKGLRPRVTVIGTGPEARRLGELATTGGVADQVNFAGGKSSEELSVILPRHKIMVVPSRWLEPFGIVAVEGVASGCVVVGTTGGGLPEAIGPCGPLYPNGDVEGLTGHLEKLLSDDQLMGHYRMQSESHLRRFRLPEVARSYLRIFEKLLNGGNGATPSASGPREPKQATI